VLLERNRRRPSNEEGINLRKDWKKFSLCLLGAGMMLSLAGCGNKNPDGGETVLPPTEKAAGAEKQDLVMIITQATDFDKSIEEKLHGQFDEKYNLIFKTWEEANVEQTVKTAATANEQIDLVKYWPMQMETFLNADLATDLTPYMDAEWKERFTNVDILKMGTYNEKLYNIPYDNVYPVLIANLDIVKQAGVTLPESGAWTWAEFEAACKTVEENTDAFGAGIQKDQACWLPRNMFLQVWENEEDMNRFIQGEISFKDPKIEGGLERIKEDFAEGLFYPGEGALAVTQDQLYAAFSQGKYAFMFIPTSNVVGALEKTGITAFQIMDFPAWGSQENPPLLGGCNGWFIPGNAKNAQGAVEVMKFLQSEEISTYRLDAGKLVVTKAGADSKVEKELLSTLTRNANQIQPKEIMGLDAELNQYVAQLMPANYINNGASALDELDDLREAAIQK